MNDEGIRIMRQSPTTTSSLSLLGIALNKLTSAAPRQRLNALALAVIGIASLCFADQASAQFHQQPGGYIRGFSGVGLNPVTGSVHVPGQVVFKPSGSYQAVGGGYYQNPMTGNKYNPGSGAYLQGSRPGYSQVEQRPGGYIRGAWGTGFNPVTGAVHVPGQVVFKQSGVYQPIGGGYYRNPATGNTYNPGSGAYLRNW